MPLRRASAPGGKPWLPDHPALHISLSHSGGIVAVLQICGVSYKDGYKHLFVVTVVITLMALALSVIMGNILYPIAA